MSRATESGEDYKIVVLGREAVGKTAIVHRFVNNSFGDDYDPTQDEEKHKISCVVDGSKVNLTIIDTPGGKDLSDTRIDGWIGQGDGFMLVYAIEGKKYFDEVADYHEAILRVTHDDEPPMALVGNKLDQERIVDFQEGSGIAHQWGCSFFEVSAKKKQSQSQNGAVRSGIEEPFFEIVRNIRKHKKAKSEAKSPAGKKPGGKKPCIIL